MSYLIEYVWIDGIGGLRSKIRFVDTLDFEELEWNYDGSSTGQAVTEDSEVILKPVEIYTHGLYYYKYKEMIKDNDIKPYLLLCKAEDKEGNPVLNNNYDKAKEIFDNDVVRESEPWFGLEQEYFIVDPMTDLPIGFGEVGKTNKVSKCEPVVKQGPYYCGNGSYQKIGRDIAEKHAIICKMTGLTISGINAEVAYGQWEYQIGPVLGIQGGNELWMSRYLLIRVAEEEGYNITFDPKPITWGKWNGSGCHTNFSTKKMRTGDRENNGLHYIMEAMTKLETKHREHLEVYGTGNEKRLTGSFETSSMDQFSYGIGSRNTSIRIGNSVNKDKCGYFEDRRPSSNMDPYLVTSILCKTILL